MKQVGKHIVSGIITVIPLWVTWLAVEFVFRKLLSIGAPVVGAIRRTLSQLTPGIADHVSWPIVDKIIAITLTILIFYIIGWAAHRVFGRQLIGRLEELLGRVPMIKTIYGGVRQLLSTLEGQSKEGQRIVLINFPSEEMKTVGILTRTMTEEATGRSLAIVYVPTTPNPTSGYVEIVPMEQVVATDWTFDEAMSFIVSAGAIAPERSMKYAVELSPAALSRHSLGTAAIGS